jgi:hypothetical protein
MGLSSCLSVKSGNQQAKHQDVNPPTCFDATQQKGVGTRIVCLQEA